MAVSLNSVIRFNPSARYEQVTRAKSKVLLLKIPSSTYLSGRVGIRQSTRRKRPRLYLLASGGDNVATESTDENSQTIKALNSSVESPSANAVNSSTKTDEKVEPSDEAALTPQVSEVANGPANANQSELGSAGKPSSTLKKSSLTARERLRAARVLSRYTESSKPSKPPELGSRLLDALTETDKGKKRWGLPEAPANLFDDSKRGLPKEGWTFNFPGGMDAFFIVFSFVFISSVMFATTYIVWKVGAIHFNEY